MPDRIHSSDTQLFINSVSIPAITSLSVDTTKKVTDIRRLGTINVAERVLASNQSTSIDVAMNLATGATGVDPFYQFQQQGAGFLSTGKFRFDIKDTVGVTTVQEASLTSYSIRGSVGSIVEGSASYEGNGASFTSAGAITANDQREDRFIDGFFAPHNIEITTVTDGKEGMSSDALNIQDFDLSIGIARTPVKRLGELNPSFRYPEIPSAGSLTFNIIKNAVTGIDISKLVCDTGVIKIDLKDNADNSVFDFTTSGCCLESVEESNTLDDNTTVSFSYYFPIIQ